MFKSLERGREDQCGPLRKGRVARVGQATASRAEFLGGGPKTHNKQTNYLDKLINV